MRKLNLFLVLIMVLTSLVLAAPAVAGGGCPPPTPPPCFVRSPGYWANHWPMGETGPVTVTVAGQGYTSMPQVKGDKAMILVRQMIAAKLNRFWDCGCEKVKWAYREGEKWLLSDPQPGWGYIEGYKDILDAFNNGKWCP